MKSNIVTGWLSSRKNARSVKRRVSRKVAGKHRFELLEKRQLMAADLSAFLTHEHVDINLAHSGGVWSIGPRNSDEVPAIQYANDGALMYAGSPARLARPAGADFNFIGVGPGEDFYMLPQSQNPELLYLGFAGYGLDSSLDIYNASAQSKGRVTGSTRWAQAALTELRHFNPDGTPGTGHFSLWQTGSFGGSTVFISSYNDGVANPNASGLDVTDGISTDDVMWINAGGHAHFNFGFTQPGRYEVDLKLSAYFGSDGNNTTPNTAGYNESLPITIYFSVMSVGQLQFEAASYSVNESAGTASIDVIRTGGSDGRIIVDYATSNGTALAGSDYTTTAGTLVFLDGQTRQTITIPIIDDASTEGDETFTVQLSEPGPVNMDDYLKDFEADANGLLGNTTSTTITILANDQPNSAPVAVADLYRIAPGNALRGNVLLNDSDVDGDSLTASLVNSTTKGALTFNLNGTFTYVPDSTFNGIDQFAYRASDGAMESEIVLVTINLAGDQRFDAALTDDHVDIGFGYEAGAWDLHVHDEHSDQEYDPYRAVLHVGAAAVTTRAGASSDSAFDFLGVAVGESFYALPQSPNPDLIYLGIATEEIAIGAFQGDLVTLHLKAVNGPGHVSIWETTVTGPDLKMATVDGITAADRLLISANTHLHFNYAFSARGSYEITLEAVATLPDGTVSSSGDVTYRFVVNSPGNAVDDVFTVTEDMVLSIGAVGGLLANDVDPDGDALRAALVQGPANGRVTINPDGSFVYVPNVNFFGTDTFTYTTTDVRYRIVPLGTLGGNSSFALDVNNERQVSGNSNNSALTGNPLQAYLWHNGVLTPLGVLPGTGTNNFSRGYAVNDEGMVVGESDNNASMAFVFEDNLMSGLTRLAGDNFRGVAHDVNNSSVIVGISSNGTVSRPTIWTFDGTKYVAADLGTISGTATSTGRAWAINEDGLVVGLSHNADGVSQATLWNGTAITNLTSLGNGARFSQAYGLNKSGLIVGASSTGQTVGELIGTSSTTGITRAFVWENGEIAELLPHNFYAPGNTGSTTNYHSVAMDVNDAGVIVGNSQRISGSAAIATLWVNGAAMDLNALIPAGSGWVLRSAEGINGGGDVVGFGSFGGFTRAFMLIPEVVSSNGQPFSNLATVTITVAGVQDAPEAIDDTYLALPGNQVHGNVLLNDYEPDGDTMTATIATHPSHGTAVLSANGSFVYTPGESFAGLDSFTYTVSDGMGGSDIATVTIKTASMPTFAARLRNGHADIGVAYGVHEHDDGHGHSHGSTEGVWDLHIHTHDPDAEYEPSEALFYVGRAAMGVRGVTDAAYDFLGVPVGGTLFILPQNENTNLPFLGISGEELGEGLLAGDVAKLQLVAVSGPGDFSVWQAGLTPTTPRVFMATSDGIDQTDLFEVQAGTHAHMNFAFTKPGFYEVTFVASGVDADGHATDSGPVTYYFFVTDGLVPFARPVDYQGGLSASSFNSVMADFNGDGFVDFVSGNSGTDTLGYWQGTGGSGFLPQTSINAGTGQRAEGIAFADYDSDGDLDVIALEFTSVANTGTITLYRNDGTATFTREVLASGLPNSFRVAVDDLNGDGRPDVVLPKGSTTLVYRLQQASGELGPEVVLPQVFTTTLTGLQLGDMNNDGHLDIVASNNAGAPNSFVSIFINNGDGTFGAAQNLMTGNFPRLRQLADMTGDGRLDMVVSDVVGSSRLGYYPQLPDGSFGTRVPLFDGITQVNSLSIADINGDGVADIIASVVRGSFRLEWAPGLGNGEFGAPVYMAEDGFSYSIHTVDIDGDHDVDVVRLGSASAARPGSLGVLINQIGENPMVLIPPAARLRVSGDPIDLEVYFGFPISVTGTPRIALQVGASTGYANYLSGAGTPTLKFRYVVTSSDLDLDGVQLASNLIDLNGGALTDPLGGAAVLEFPNLPFNGVIVNGAGPLVQSITRLDDRATTAAQVRFQVQFTEPVTGVAVSDFEVRNTEGNLTGTNVISASGSGSIYEVTVSTGTGSGTLGLSVKDSASINDLAGDVLAKGLQGGQVYTIRQQPLPVIDVYYTNGHADYRPIYTNGEFSYIVDADPGVLPESKYPSDAVYTYADSNAIVSRPAAATYNFLGVAAGAPLYVLPSTNNPSLPYLGLSGESLTAGQFALYRPDDSRLNATPREYVKVQMVGMRSSSGGEFSMYSISGGNPVVWMASSDGISDSDNFWLYRTHFHRNLAFSKPGIYEIDVVVSGYLDSNVNGTLDLLSDTYVESGTFTMVFNVDTLGARDDAFSVSGSDIVRGSVIHNDPWAEGFGSYVASMQTSTTKGTLSLQPNGSFTYQPSPTFDGSDSFTYRLTNQRGGFTTATVTLTGLARPDFEAVLTTGHADIGVNFDQGQWDLHIHDGENDVEYEPHEALLYVGSIARTIRAGAAADAAFDFLGAPVGSAIFVLPEVENTNLLYLGIGGEELGEGRLVDDVATLQLVSVTGPGEFSVWQAGLMPTMPRLFMATSDGIDASDKFDVTAGSHAHVNFAFTKLGFYAVTFIASGIDAEGNVTDSGPVTYYFQVGNTVESLDVQNGQPQRSFVRNVDLLLSQDDNLDELLAAGRVQVTKFDLNGENAIVLAASAFAASIEGKRLKLDFGAQGVGGNRNSDTGDGYYRVGLDVDGDGSADVYKHFYRLLGDINGDRQVNALDRLLVMRGNVPGSPSVDVNGDGVVNSVDLTLVTRAQGRKLKTGLSVDD